MCKHTHTHTHTHTYTSYTYSYTLCIYIIVLYLKQIKFLESDWYIDTLDGNNPSYKEMLEVLGDLKAIKIRAKYVNVSMYINYLGERR